MCLITVFSIFCNPEDLLPFIYSVIVDISPLTASIYLWSCCFQGGTIFPSLSILALGFLGVSLVPIKVVHCFETWWWWLGLDQWEILLLLWHLAFQLFPSWTFYSLTLRNLSLTLSIISWISSSSSGNSSFSSKNWRVVSSIICCSSTVDGSSGSPNCWSKWLSSGCCTCCGSSG